MHKSIPSLMCRVCGTAEETIVHLLAACHILATTAYLHRHNLVAAVIHWHLMRFYSFQSCSRSWYSHKPPPVIESSSAKILWDFILATSHNHPSNRHDIVLYDFRQQEIFFIEISCPADINVSIKEDEKINKCLSLATDFCWMYNTYANCNPPSCSGMYGRGLLLLFAVFKENPRVYNETVWPPTESCTDWDFTSITNNTPSPMNYFLCNCTCYSSILLYCCTCESVNENLVVVVVVY